MEGIVVAGEVTSKGLCICVWYWKVFGSDADGCDDEENVHGDLNAFLYVLVLLQLSQAVLCCSLIE